MYFSSAVSANRLERLPQSKYHPGGKTLGPNVEAIIPVTEEGTTTTTRRSSENQIT